MIEGERMYIAQLSAIRVHVAIKNHFWEIISNTFQKYINTQIEREKFFVLRLRQFKAKCRLAIAQMWPSRQTDIDCVYTDIYTMHL